MVTRILESLIENYDKFFYKKLFALVTVTIFPG